jgi:uncharacterized protein (TIGR02300 family)
MPMDAERKARLGAKWTCYSCGSRFYDLNKPEPLCPKCGADQRESPVFEKPKRARKKAAPKKAEIPAALSSEFETSEELEIEGEALAGEDLGFEGLEAAVPADEAAEVEEEVDLEG